MPRYYERFVPGKGWVRRKVPKQPPRPRGVLAGTLSKESAVKVAADYRRRGQKAHIVRRYGEFHNWLVVKGGRKFSQGKRKQAKRRTNPFW